MKSISVNNSIHNNLMARKKAWKKKTLADTVAYLIDIAESFEMSGMTYDYKKERENDSS